jgi:type VI protein secretion system component VasK
VAAAAVTADANAAKLSTRQITSTLPVDLEAHLETKVNDLMLQPITNVERFVGGSSEINAKGRAFCLALDPLLRKFPFNPNAKPEVTLDELDSLFKGKESKLWQFYEFGLKNFIVCNGADCAIAPSPPAPVDPRFLAFFKQAVAFSRAIYGEGAADPSFRYTLRPIQSDQVDEFDLSVNGDSAHLNGGGQRTFAWPGAGTPSFRLDLKLSGGTPLGVQSRDGLWSVFRFFADADTTSRSGAGYDFRWNFRQGQGSTPPIVKGRPLSYEFFVDTNGAPAVFSKDFLSGLKCVPTVAH